MRRLARPSTWIWGGVGTTLAIAGFLAVQQFTYQRLPRLLEAELSRLLQRPVKLGEIESLTFNQLRLGASSVPPTATDPSNLSIPSTTITFNPLGYFVGKPLLFDANLVNPTLYIQQDKNGKWLTFQPTQEEKKLRLLLDATLHLNNAQVILKPYGTKNVIPMNVGGKIRYQNDLDKQNQWLEYNVAIAYKNSELAAKGSTYIETGQTKVALSLNKASLSELTALIPNFPAVVSQGIGNGNVNLDLPNIEQIEQTRTLGNLAVNNVKAKITTFKDPLQANLKLGLQGQQVVIQQGQLRLGKLIADLGGFIDWKNGYNLSIKTNTLSVKDTFNTFSIKTNVIPIGNIQGNFKITGLVDNPLVTGNLINRGQLTVERIPLQTFNASIRANLNQIFFPKVTIQPTEGGTILANGRVDINLRNSIQQNKPIRWQTMPLILNFQGQLPIEKIIKPYYVPPSNVRLAPVSTTGRIDGTLARAATRIQWVSLQPNTVAQVPINGSGEILLFDENLNLRNTVLRTNTGTLLLDATTNFKRDRWNAKVQANQFAVTPFINAFCQQGIIPNCPTALRTEPLTITNANFMVGGLFDRFDPNRWQGSGSLALRGRTEAIAVEGRLNQGNIQANILATNVRLNPYLAQLTVPVTVQRTQAQLAGSLKTLWTDRGLNLNDLQGNANVQLTVANNPVTANANLNQGVLKTAASLSSIPLNGFIPNLPVNARLIRGNVNLAGNWSDYRDFNLRPLTGNADLRLAVDGSSVNLRSEIAQGQATAIADFGRFSVTRFIPNLRTPASITKGRITATADLEQVLQSQPNLQSVDAIADIQGTYDRLAVSTTTAVNNNRWQSLIQASSTNGGTQLPNVPRDISQLLTNDLAANLRLSGSLTNVFDSTATLPIRAEAVSIRSGQKNIQAQGNLVLTQLFDNPRLSQVNLAVQANTSLNDPLINRLVRNALANVNQRFRPSEVRLAGLANFVGNIQGMQVTSLDNLRLAGNVTLNNLVVNNQRFEPRLAGTLNVKGRDRFDINLRGQEDVIALSLESCARCAFPYVPIAFNLRQTYGDTIPIIAEGNRLGDRLSINVTEFPLAFLNIPAYNFPGTVKGSLNAQLTFNVVNLTGRGNIQVQNLGIGNLVADNFNTELDFQNNFLQFNNTTLQLGTSAYRLSGGINLKTQALQARLRIQQGQIQKLLAALQISDVASLRRLFQFNPRDYASAKQVPPISVGKTNGPLSDQLNLLHYIDQTIQQLAQRYEAGGVPNELRIEGLFNADIALSGTLTQPQVNVNVSGEHWSWYPQSAFPAIIPPLGLVLTDSRFIPIHRVNLQANLANGVLTVQPSSVQIKNSLISLEGNFSNQQNSAIWEVENLSLDTINNLVRLPGDITGDINAQGSITGTLSKPQLRGEFSFVNASINARPIEQAIAGNFNYTGDRLQVITEQNSPLFFYASIPYSIGPKPKQAAHTTEQFEARVRLNTDALKLLGALTQDQLTWLGGTGEVNLSAVGNLEINNQVRLSDFKARGSVTLQDAVFQSPILPSPITMTGNINLDNRLIRVQQLAGTFAQSQLLISGDLPIFRPQNNLENPLNLAISKATLDINNLYKGDVEGNVIVRGSAFSPTLSGAVKLSNGQVFIPEQIATQPTQFVNPWSKPRQTKALIVPKLDNFQVSLDNLFIEQTPLYDFSFGGQLALNGSLDNLNRVEPRGAITLNRGRISFLDTRFLLERRYANEIVFKPEQGLFNPDLNIRMRTIVSELPQSQRLRSADSSEIPDDTLNRVQRIDINLAVNGSLDQLLPNVNQSNPETCQSANEFQPFAQTANISREKLNRLATCLQVLAAKGDNNSQLLSNPAIQLSSSPPRSQGEIVRLLGEQFIVLADALQGKSTGQLLQYGITQLAIPMIFQGIVYDIETTVSSWVGSTDIRVVPYLEAIYEVDKNSYVRFSYDYSFNEVRVRYEKQF